LSNRTLYNLSISPNFWMILETSKDWLIYNSAYLKISLSFDFKQPTHGYNPDFISKYIDYVRF
jgi:hypothetical protein